MTMKVVFDDSSRTSAKALREGQVWRVADTNFQIMHVGKRLVHYKRLEGKINRVRALMTGRSALEEYLRAHHGVLIREERS